MRQNVYFKLYISLLIFAFLIFIIPSVFVNMIGYIFLDLARPIMFISKFIDLLIFVSIAMAIDLIIIFIIWLNVRTVIKDGKFVRTINGLDFEKSNIVSIKKKRFGLMLLVTFELNNYKNIHYFSNNSDELNKWLEELNLLDLLEERLYKFDKLRFYIKVAVLVFSMFFVFGDAYTSNKTFRKGDSSVYIRHAYMPMNFNNDYIVTHLNIYNRKTGKRIPYATTSSYPKDGEYSYINYLTEINLYNDYFVVTLYSVPMHNHSNFGDNIKLIEEIIDYNGSNKGFIKDVEIDRTEMSDYINDYSSGMFNGDYINMYILNKNHEPKNDIYDYCYSKRGKNSCLNLEGNIKTIGDFKYFTLHVYKKRNDERYIGLSGLYRYNVGTEDIEVIKEFTGKKIVSFNENQIIYIDYKTVYRYDLNTEKNEKVITLPDYKNMMIYNTENGIVIDCYYKTIVYFLDLEGKYLGKGRSS